MEDFCSSDNKYYFIVAMKILCFEKLVTPEFCDIAINSLMSNSNDCAKILNQYMSDTPSYYYIKDYERFNNSDSRKGYHHQICRSLYYGGEEFFNDISRLHELISIRVSDISSHCLNFVKIVIELVKTNKMLILAFRLLLHNIISECFNNLLIVFKKDDHLMTTNMSIVGDPAEFNKLIAILRLFTTIKSIDINHNRSGLFSNPNTQKQKNDFECHEIFLFEYKIASIYFTVDQRFTARFHIATKYCLITCRGEFDGLFRLAHPLFPIPQKLVANSMIKCCLTAFNQTQRIAKIADPKSYQMVTLFR